MVLGASLVCWRTKARRRLTTCCCSWRGSFDAASKSCRILPVGPEPRGLGVSRPIKKSALKGVSEGGQLVGAQRHGFPFPIGNDPLGGAQSLGQLKLRQPRALSRAGQPLSKSGSCLLRRSSRWHDSIIPGLKKVVRNGLHKYTLYVYFDLMSKNSFPGLTASGKIQTAAKPLTCNMFRGFCQGVFGQGL